MQFYAVHAYLPHIKRNDMSTPFICGRAIHLHILSLMVSSPWLLLACARDTATPSSRASLRMADMAVVDTSLTLTQEHRVSGSDLRRHYTGQHMHCSVPATSMSWCIHTCRYIHVHDLWVTGSCGGMPAWVWS